MSQFKQNTVSSWCSDKNCFFLFCCCEKFCKNNNFWLYFSCLFNHPLSNIQLCSMKVIKSKAIENSSHSLDIFSHVFPSSGIFRSFSVSDSNEISPDRNFSSEIIEVLSCHQILICVGAHNPAIVQSRNCTLFHCLDMRKVRVDEWKLIFVLSDFCLKIVVSDFTYKIVNNLMFPFILYDIFPFVVELSDTEFDIIGLICVISLSPFLGQIFNSDTISSLPKANAMSLNELKHQFAGVFGKYIIGRLPGLQTLDELFSQRLFHLEKFIQLESLY